MKYLIVGQSGQGEPIYKARKTPRGWDWTYYRPHARRYSSRIQADAALERYQKKRGPGLRFAVPVTMDVVFRQDFRRIVFRRRSDV